MSDVLSELPLIANGGTYNPGFANPYPISNAVTLDNGWIVATYTYKNAVYTPSVSKMYVVCSKDKGSTWQNVAVWNSTVNLVYDNLLLASKGNSVALLYCVNNTGSASSHVKVTPWVADLSTFSFGTTYTNRHDGSTTYSFSSYYLGYFNLIWTHDNKLAYAYLNTANGYEDYYIVKSELNGTAITSGFVETNAGGNMSGFSFVQAANNNFIGLVRYQGEYATHSAVEFDYATMAKTYRSGYGGSISLDAYYGYPPAMVVCPDGMIVSMFTGNSNDGNSWTIRIATSTNNGTSFSSSGALTTIGATLNTRPASLAVDDAGTKFYLTTLGSDGSQIRLKMVEITRSGSTFTVTSSYFISTKQYADTSVNNVPTYYGGKYNNKKVISLSYAEYWGGTSFNEKISVYTKSLNTAPNAPTITYPTSNAFVGNLTPTVTWTYSDPDSGDTQSAFNIEIVNASYSAQLWVSGWISSAATSYTIPSGILSSGVGYYVRIQVKDSSGTINEANGRGPDPQYDSIYFVADTTPPVIGSISGGGYTASATKRVTISGVSDATSGVGLVHAYILNKAGTTWSGPYNATNAGGGSWYYDFNASYEGEGAHTIRFWVYDNAPNMAAGGAFNATFIDSFLHYDATSPVVPTQTNGTLYATSNGVSWSAFSDGVVSSGLLLTTLYLQQWNGSAWVVVSGFPKSVAELTYNFTGLTSATQYRWGVTYTDNAGNVSTLNYTTFTTNSYAVSTSVNLASAGYMLNKRPKFKFTVTDANDGTLSNFQLQVSAASDFATTLLDTTSGAAPAGWSATSLSSGSTGYYTPQADITAGTRYVRIRAFDGKDWGAWSAAVSFVIQDASYPTAVSSGDTAVSKRTIDDLRVKVNAVRQARGFATVSWTDSTIKDWNDAAPTPIRAQHMIELRKAIMDVQSTLAELPTNNPTQTLTFNFVGKVAGSTIENPNIAKFRTGTATLLVPSSGLFSEYAVANYTNAQTLNGVTVNSSTITATNIPQHLFSFDLISSIEKQLGTPIIGATTADKVTWLKTNVKRLVGSWYGYGSGPNGSRANLGSWQIFSSSWTTTSNHTSNTVRLLSKDDSAYISDRIDSNGFVHYLAWTDASDGTTTSTISTDYFELLVDLPPRLTANFVGKVSGSTTENPHLMRRGSFLSPVTNQEISTLSSESSDSQYLQVLSNNGVVSTTTSTTNSRLVAHGFSFDLISEVERKLNTSIPGTTTADKSSWLKSNISRLIFNFRGYGSGKNGYKTNLSAWRVDTSSWFLGSTNTASNTALLAFNVNSGNGAGNTPTNMIDSNGFVQFIVYTDPSDGTTASTINTDYVELLIDIPANVLPMPTWTDPIVDTTIPRKGQHWLELRTALALT